MYFIYSECWKSESFSNLIIGTSYVIYEQPKNDGQTETEPVPGQPGTSDRNKNCRQSVLLLPYEDTRTRQFAKHLSAVVFTR